MRPSLITRCASVWGQLIVALYRCGRQADALNAYRRAPRTLAELGIEPGPALRVLERMILVQDPALSMWANSERRLPQYATSLVARRRHWTPSPTTFGPAAW